MLLTLSTPAEIDSIAREVSQVADRLGFGSGRYQLIRSGSNLVLGNDRDRVLARIPTEYIDLVALAGRLSACPALVPAGAPVLPPLHREVVRLPSGHRVTFWPLAEADVSVDGRDLARLAIGCHQISAPSQLPVWQPRIRVPDRLAQLEAGRRNGLPPSMAIRLRDLFDQSLQDVVDHYHEPDSPPVFIHGDLYSGNIVRFNRQLLLCDLDNICSGPREVDLAKIKNTCHHITDPADWVRFQADYPETCDQVLVDKLARMQAVESLLWHATFWGNRPAVRIEINRRLDNLDNPTFKWINE